MSAVAQRQYVSVRLGDGGTAATADDKHVAVGGTGDWLVEKVACAFETAVTADDTDHAKVALQAEDGTEIASALTTTAGTGTLTAYQGFAVAITGTGTDLQVTAPGSLRVALTKPGLGVQVDDAEVTVTLKKLQV